MTLGDSGSPGTDPTIHHLQVLCSGACGKGGRPLVASDSDSVPGFSITGRRHKQTPASGQAGLARV